MNNPQVAVKVTADTRSYVTSMDRAALSTTKVDKAARNTQTQADRLSRAFNGLSASLGKQAGAALASGVALKKVTDFYRSAADAATRLQDSAAAATVVFGRSAEQIKAFAEDAKQSFGLTQAAAYDAATTFAIYGKAAGLAGDELAAFSIELTQRAVDLSSFFGTETTDAITAIGAAMRGEMEPIRAYGVLLNDAALRQKALEMGLVSTTKNALDPQTRALVAAQLVLEQTTDAAGDYKRTQDGLANSTRDLSAQWGRFKEQVGTALAPLLSLGLKATAAAVDFLAKAFQGLVHQIDVMTGPLQTVLRWMGLLDDEQVDAASGSSELAARAAEASAQLDGLGASAAGAAGGVKTLAEAQQDAVDAAFSYLNAQINGVQAGDRMLGIEDRLRESLKQSTTATVGRTRATKADTDALGKQEAAIRKADRAAEQREIKAAQRAAKRKAERRADAQARADVQKGVAGAIATDKAARRGEDIDGFNQTGQVGEYSGALTDAEQKKLDKRIDAIRAKHKKSVEEQIKSLKAARTAATATANSVGSVSAATDRYSSSLDANTTAGRHNREALAAEMEGVLRDARAIYDAAIAAGDDVPTAWGKAEDAIKDGRNAIEDAAAKFGLARSQVRDFLRELDKMPPDIELQLKIYGLAQLSELERRVKAVERKIPVSLLDDGAKAQGPRRSGGSTFAAGGPVYGPGSGTSDSVPAWLSNGEYVIRASAYARNRDLVHAINSGGRAGGPLVGSISVTAPRPDAAGRAVIDSLAEVAYRHGVVR